MAENQVEIEKMNKKKVCVVGGTGFVASLLVKLLLEKNYIVNMTVRDPGNVFYSIHSRLIIKFSLAGSNSSPVLLFALEGLATLDVNFMSNSTINVEYIITDDEKKISHLLALQNLGKLNIFRANLTDEGSFDATVQDCDIVFLVATPVNFASPDPEVIPGVNLKKERNLRVILMFDSAEYVQNDMINPAIQGVRNVLSAGSKAKSVKRVLMTSSAAAVTINSLPGTGLVMTENDWSDVDFLYSEKPPTWGYPVSKTLAEKEAWKFAQENNLDLITVIPTLMAGPSLTPDVPSSIGLATSLITGNEFLVDALKGMQMLSGSISITHVEDVCRAHVFLAGKEAASGRYLCCAVNTSVPELSDFLSKRFPKCTVPTEFGEFPSKAKVMISSEKLVKEGFEFKHGIEGIYDQTGIFEKQEYLEELMKEMMKNCLRSMLPCWKPHFCTKRTPQNVHRKEISQNSVYRHLKHQTTTTYRATVTTY